jgi:hypothetical protein
VQLCSAPAREAALVEATRGAPYAEAIVHDQLNPRAACVGEDIAVVGSRGAEDLHYARQEPVAGAHVHRLLHQYLTAFAGPFAAHMPRNRSHSTPSPPRFTTTGQSSWGHGDTPRMCENQRAFIVASEGSM